METVVPTNTFEADRFKTISDFSPMVLSQEGDSRKQQKKTP